MELLKQPLSHPLSMHEQVLTLCMATDGVFDKIPTRQVKQYQKDILDFMDLKHPEIGKEIEQTKALSDELRQKSKMLQQSSQQNSKQVLRWQMQRNSGSNEEYQ